MQNMKSLTIFDPSDSDTETVNKWIQWKRDNQVIPSEKMKVLVAVYG